MLVHLRERDDTFIIKYSNNFTIYMYSRSKRPSMLLMPSNAPSHPCSELRLD